MKYAGLRRYYRHGVLTQLMVFDAVVRHQSLTRAAAELHLAQPTVSIQMKKLAETVGAPLFESHGRGIRLTQAGEELASACKQIFEYLGSLEGRLEALRPSAIRLGDIVMSNTMKPTTP